MGLSENIKKCYIRFCGGEIDDKAATLLGKLLPSFRGLHRELALFEENVLKDLFSKSIEDLVYYPCDLIELRLIFRQNEIKSGPTCFFSLDFAKKHLSHEYSLILCFQKPLPIKVFGGVAIDFGDCVNVEQHLKRVYYNDKFCLLSESAKP